MSDLRIATRGSRLAMKQSNLVADRLRAAHPGLQTELIIITTSGDLDQTSPVATLTEVGAFVRSVQMAVLDGRADLAVHSGKDLPVVGPDGLAQIHPTRISPWDVLCGSTLDGLAIGATVGTGSPRRAAQLRMLRPDLAITEIRGNVDTRLAKVKAGDYAATILAEAGLQRMGLEDEITDRFDVTTMVPAAAQGALTLEALEGSDSLALAMAIDDSASRATVESERFVLEISGAGCRSALGASASETSDGIRIVGFVEDAAGPRRSVADGPNPRSAARNLCAALGIAP